MITVCPSPATDVGQDAAAARVELREHVVEQQQRGRGQQLGLGEQEREQREPLLALRAEAAQLAAAAAISRSSRCGPSPVVPRARSASRRASSAARVGGSPS